MSNRCKVSLKKISALPIIAIVFIITTQLNKKHYAGRLLIKSYTEFADTGKIKKTSRGNDTIKKRLTDTTKRRLTDTTKRSPTDTN